MAETTIIDKFFQMTHCRDCVSARPHSSGDFYCFRHCRHVTGISEYLPLVVDGSQRCDLGSWLFIDRDADCPTLWGLTEWLNAAYVERYRLTLVPRDKWPLWANGDGQYQMVGDASVMVNFMEGDDG